MLCSVNNEEKDLLSEYAFHSGTTFLWILHVHKCVSLFNLFFQIFLYIHNMDADKWQKVQQFKNRLF